MFMLSLGTGKVKKRYTYKEAKDWGPVGWAKPVLDIMMTGVAETVDYQLRKIFASVGVGSQYVRIEPDLGRASADLDDASNDNIVELERAGNECVIQNQQTLNAVAMALAGWTHTVSAPPGNVLKAPAQSTP